MELLKVIELFASIVTVDGLMFTDGRLLTVTVLVKLATFPVESSTVIVTE